MKSIYSFVATLLIIFICFGFYVPPKQVFAQSEYRRVINKNTPFYKSSFDEQPLFYLPYTYYVKVIGQSANFCHVEINGENGQMGIDGYVPTEQLFYDGQEVLSPYLNLWISTVDTAVLYADLELSTPIQYIFAERSLLYFGENQAKTGKVFYVAYNNKLGYVKEGDIMPFIIQNHPNPLSFLDGQGPKENTNNVQSNTLVNIKSAIIVCLLLAGLIALFIALSNKKQSNKTLNYYEENDYE